MDRLKFIRVLLALVSVLPSYSWSAEHKNAVSTGIFTGGPVPFNGAVIEYERRLGSKLSLGMQIGSFSYNYKDGNFQEKGERTGGNILLRYNQVRHNFTGFYIGGGLGYWDGYYDFVDPNDNPASGHIKTPSYFFLATTGWKIPLGESRIYLDPRLSWGAILQGRGNENKRESEKDNSILKSFISLGLNVGVKF